MSIKKFGNTTILMNRVKSITLLITILCVSIVHAEESTYIKQQVAYKDQDANGKELTWDFGMLSPINEEYRSTWANGCRANTPSISMPITNWCNKW